MGKITINRARKLLGKEYKKHNDKQIQQIIDQLYGLAELVNDKVFLGSNKLPKVIDPLTPKDQNVIR